MTPRTTQDWSAAFQQMLTLPMRREVVVSATPAGNVRIEITNARTGEMVAWLESDPREADRLAATITAVTLEIWQREHPKVAQEAGADA